MIRSERPRILLTIDMMTFVPTSDQMQLHALWSTAQIPQSVSWHIGRCCSVWIRYVHCAQLIVGPIPPSARASYEISNILVLSNHQTVSAPKTRTYTRIAMAKRRMYELSSLLKAWSIPVALAMRLVKTLVWTVLSYGAEACTLKMRDERKITSTKMCWRVRKNWR